MLTIRLLCSCGVVVDDVTINTFMSHCLLVEGAQTRDGKTCSSVFVILLSTKILSLAKVSHSLRSRHLRSFGVSYNQRFLSVGSSRLGQSAVQVLFVALEILSWLIMTHIVLVDFDSHTKRFGKQCISIGRPFSTQADVFFNWGKHVTNETAITPIFLTRHPHA